MDRSEQKGLKLSASNYLLWGVKKGVVRKSLERGVNPRRVSTHGVPPLQVPGDPDGRIRYVYLGERAQKTNPFKCFLSPSLLI